MFNDLRKTWLFSLLGRLILFFVLFSLLILFLYIIGNYQEFLDSSQFLLLKILEVVSLFGGICATYYIFFLFFIVLVEKKLLILRFILTIISIVLCIILFSGIKFLSSWFNPPPIAPTGFFISGMASSRIDLDWKDNRESDLSKYRVYRSTGGDFFPDSSTFIGDSFVSAFSDTGLTSETTYYYKVTAVDTSANESPASAEAFATTLVPVPGSIRAQYACTNTESTAPEIAFDVYLYNDDDTDVTLSDITIRYWFTPEPAVGDIVTRCNFADVNAQNITFSFGSVDGSAGATDYLDIGFTSAATVPTRLGGDGTGNSLPGGAQTGQLQISLFDDISHVLFDQENDWSFDPGKTSPADWDRITVHYMGKFICRGEAPFATDTIPPVLSGPADLTCESGSSGNTINWCAFDQHPGSYSVVRDRSDVESGSWTNDSLISISADGLEAGTWSYTITVQDQEGNSSTDTILVTVEGDGTPGRPDLYPVR